MVIHYRHDAVTIVAADGTTTSWKPQPVGTCVVALRQDDGTERALVFARDWESDSVWLDLPHAGVVGLLTHVCLGRDTVVSFARDDCRVFRRSADGAWGETRAACEREPEAATIPDGAGGSVDLVKRGNVWLPASAPGPARRFGSIDAAREAQAASAAAGPRGDR